MVLRFRVLDSVRAVSISELSSLLSVLRLDCVAFAGVLIQCCSASGLYFKLTPPRHAGAEVATGRPALQTMLKWERAGRGLQRPHAAVQDACGLSSQSVLRRLSAVRQDEMW